MGCWAFSPVGHGDCGMKWRWSEEELSASWFLSAEEASFLSARTAGSQLGMAVQLKFFQSEGRFPQSGKDVPADVLRYLARQIAVSENELVEYEWKGRTARRQRLEIFSWLGFRRFQPVDRIALNTWLQRDVFPQNPSEVQQMEQVTVWFQEKRLAPLNASALERLVRSQWRAFESGLLEECRPY